MDVTCTPVMRHTYSTGCFSERTGMAISQFFQGLSSWPEIILHNNQKRGSAMDFVG
jgi:hypothetical protein